MSDGKTTPNASGNDSMTDAQLDAIQARCHAATKGPWKVKQANVEAPGVMSVFDGFEVATVRKYGMVRDLEICMRNAKFIAAARSDVPALLAEVKRLRELLPR